MQGLWEVCIVTKAVKAKYPCPEHEESFQVVFGINTSQDRPDVHPKYFCHACKNVLYRAKTDGYQHKTEIFMGWNEHNNDSCNVCQHHDTLRKGGRPRKGQRTPGHPPSKSPRYCIQHILKIAPSTFVLEHYTTPRICDEHQVVELEELQCPICCDILRSPVELTDCRSVVCAECCCSWIDYCEDLL